ncbi:hypothetical protein MKW92_020454 [Papaver armeniacum]|nr:hypothetical protein MKW92_020454 [Papaver armeniacum]
MAVISSRVILQTYKILQFVQEKRNFTTFRQITSYGFLGGEKAAVNTPFPCCLNNFNPTSSSTTKQQQKKLLAKNDLLDLIADEERGVKTQENPLKRMIIKAIEALQEQLFIIKNAYLFGGTQAGDILQVIDVDAGVLNNVVIPPSGVFFVRFTSAVLRGENWGSFHCHHSVVASEFDSVYIDDDIRVAKDIRDDGLVVDRAPYKWKKNELINKFEIYSFVFFPIDVPLYYSLMTFNH